MVTISITYIMSCWFKSILLPCMLVGYYYFGFYNNCIEYFFGILLPIVFNTIQNVYDLKCNKTLFLVKQIFCYHLVLTV